MSLGLGIANELLETPVDWLPNEEGLDSALNLWLQHNVDVATGSWLDSSNKNNEATQTTSANQPTLSHGGLNFDQSGGGSSKQFLDLSTTIEIAADSPFTFSFVFTVTETSNETILSDGNNEFLEIINNKKLRFKGDKPSVRTSVLEADDEIFARDTKMIMTLLRNTGGDLSLLINASQIELNESTTNQTNGHGLDITNIGARNDNDRFFSGLLSEMILYKQELTTKQLSKLHNYLSEKHNITI